MVNPWDLNAELRHHQMLGGKDITFSNLLLPKIHEILENFESSKSFSILDVGCGTGILAHDLAGRVKSVWGIDPSFKSIEIARDHTKDDKNVRFECCEIREFAIKHPGEFDLALAHMTLQTIENLESALQNVSQVLNPTGLFVFSLPHPCFWAMIKKEIGKGNYAYNYPSYHEIPFPVKTDQNLLPGMIPYYHRHLESYSTALFEAGFVIERMYEPFPNEALMKQYQRPWANPGFLFVVCRKHLRDSLQ